MLPLEPGSGCRERRPRSAVLLTGPSHGLGPAQCIVTVPLGHSDWISAALPPVRECDTEMLSHWSLRCPAAVGLLGRSQATARCRRAH